MTARKVAQRIAQIVVAIGILASLALAGGAPSEFVTGSTPTPTVRR